MTRTKSPATVRVVGIVVGLILLGAVLVFAVALPKATGTASGAAIRLPDTLPGGYTAMDLEDAYAGVEDAPAEQVQQAMEQQRANRAYAEKVLDAAYDVEVANRTYLKEDGSTLVTLQAFRAPGGAFSPIQFNDPATAQPGDPVEELVLEGDAVCVVHGQVDQAGAVATTYTECQRSEADLTLQLTASLDPEDVVRLIEQVWPQVA